MKRAWAGLWALAMLVPAQLPSARPVGLVLSPGASVERATRAAVPVGPGELLFAGDVLRAGASGAEVLVCAEQARLRFAPHAKAEWKSGTMQVAPGAIVGRVAVNSCYLPLTPRLSLANQQHYGVLAARSGSIPPPANRFEERVEAVEEPRRTELKELLRRTETALRLDAKDLLACIERAAALEQAGLLYDAGETYRSAAGMAPGTSWLNRKVTEIENQLLSRTRR